MTSEILHQTIQTILSQLDESAESLRQPLLELLAELAQNPQNHAIVQAQLLRLLRPNPQLLDAAKGLLRGQSKGLADVLESTRSVATLPAAESSRFEQPATVTRYTDIACPKRIWAQAPRITVVVRLTREPSMHSPDVQELVLRTDQPVMVRVSASAFRVLGEIEKPVAVLADADSETSFDLQPLGLTGHEQIRFTFVQGGNWLGAASVAVEIMAQEVSVTTERTAAQLIRWQTGAPPAHLMLHVAHEQIGGQPHLLFTLYENGASVGQPFAPVSLTGNPQTLTNNLYRRLTYLAEQASLGHSNLSPTDIEREVRTIGQNLWLEVMPHEFKARYAEMHGQWAGRPLLLVSDEPYIPWELVWPFDRTWEDDAPWGVTLRLTRWLARGQQGDGYDGPPASLSLGALALVMPESSFLAAVPQEAAHLVQLMEQHNIENCSPAPPELEPVRARLQSGGYQWLHVSTHGLFNGADPNDAATLQLDGEQYLTPNDFIGRDIANHLWQQRPGFVFNACHGSRLGWALTRMGGWADRLIGLGAGVFIAPLWAVGDRQALAFSQGLYEALLTQNTVAEAVYAGRRRAYRAGDPTWLAYSVYAHPNARIVING